MPYDLPLPSTLYGETVTSGTRTVGSAGSDVFVLGGQRGVVGGGAGEDVYAVTTVSYASIFDDGLPCSATTSLTGADSQVGRRRRPKGGRSPTGG